MELEGKEGQPGKRSWALGGDKALSATDMVTVVHKRGCGFGPGICHTVSLQHMKER